MNTRLQFAKIFEFSKHQVLITKEYDEDGDVYKIVQRTSFEDCEPSLAQAFNNEDSANKYFQNYDSEKAQKFLNSMLRILDFGDYD